MLIDDCKTCKPSVEPLKEIKDYPLEDLIKWRNTASKRVSKIDSDMNYFWKVLEEAERKLIKLDKKRQKDVQWIVKLNRILHKRVIKDRN